MNDQLDLTQARHAHRWLIETPNGPTCLGVCRCCGKTKEFPSWEPNEQAPNIRPEGRKRRGGWQ